MINVLVFGKNGQLAQELQKIKIRNINFIFKSSDEVNFLQPNEIQLAIQNENVDYIINAAAYTNVDAAESDKGTALQINGLAMKTISEEAKKKNCHVIHFSTDYVFDGQATQGLTEMNPISPLNYYGYTKSVGDQILQESGCSFQIFRIGWIYGVYGHNFFKTMLRLGLSKTELSVVSDQFGTPTSSSFVIKSVLQILQDPLIRQKTGLYNLAPSGQASWFDFAQMIFKLAAQKSDQYKSISKNIKSIRSDQFQTKARRPQYSVLSTEKIQNTFHLNLPTWQSDLQETFVQWPID